MCASQIEEKAKSWVSSCHIDTLQSLVVPLFKILGAIDHFFTKLVASLG